MVVTPYLFSALRPDSLFSATNLVTGIEESMTVRPPSPLQAGLSTGGAETAGLTAISKAERRANQAHPTNLPERNSSIFPLPIHSGGVDQSSPPIRPLTLLRPADRLDCRSPLSPQTPGPEPEYCCAHIRHG